MIGCYFREFKGSISVLFAFLVPVLVGISGMSLDYAQVYLVKQRLGQAVDAASLAAVASSLDEYEINKRVQAFFDVNYPEDKMGVSYIPTVNIVDDEVIVSASARYETMFLGVIGIEEIAINVSTTVLREVQGIEVVLVMDNTGSMSSHNNIRVLRDAASNFVYIMYGIDIDEGASASSAALDSMVTRDSEYIKIGLVPYTGMVNVGPYGLGEDLSGNYYGSPFVNNPLNLSYVPSSSGEEWMGCVLAEDYPTDTMDYGGSWDMYRHCRDENDAAVCNFESSWSWWSGRVYDYSTVKYDPNYYCPNSMVTPLSTSPTDLKNAIDTMEARGNTYGNLGMVWGYRVLSPDFPFTEGVEWGSPYWRKVVVMMTDGNNVPRAQNSAYGPLSTPNTSQLNERFAEVCENMKDDGALIYTITFTSSISSSTKGYYRDCATSEDYYHDAPSQDDLIDVFETIALELSNLRITQ